MLMKIFWHQSSNKQRRAEYCTDDDCHCLSPQFATPLTNYETLVSVDSQTWKWGEGRCKIYAATAATYVGLRMSTSFASHRFYVCTSRRL